MEEEGGPSGWMTWSVTEMKPPYSHAPENPGGSTTADMTRM